MKVYHDQYDIKYIVIKESENKDKVLGLTINQMLIVVNSNNERIDSYVCPQKIWNLYKEEISEAKTTPNYQICLYFGKPHIATDEELLDKGLFLSMKKNCSKYLFNALKHTIMSTIEQFTKELENWITVNSYLAMNGNYVVDTKKLRKFVDKYKNSLSYTISAPS